MIDQQFGTSIPSEFFEGVKIIPNTFNNPQNQKHGQWVHIQMRKDFYCQASNRVAAVQFQRTNKQNIIIQSIKPCGSYKLSKWAQFYLWYKNIPKQDEMIRCQDWHVKSERGLIHYQHRFYQSRLDHFHSISLTNNVLDLLKICSLNW